MIMQGSEGYKHSRKGTSVAAQSTAQAAAIKAHEFGYHKVRVKLKGLGTGRQVRIALPWGLHEQYITLQVGMSEYECT